MAVTHVHHRDRRWWEPSIIDPTDLRLAGLLMLVLGVLRPLFPNGVGLPCPLLAITGVPCPLCGMTTSVTAVMHFDFGGAVLANPAGIVAVGVAGYLLVRRPSRLRVLPLVVVVALAAMWVFELNRYGFV